LKGEIQWISHDEEATHRQVHGLDCGVSSAYRPSAVAARSQLSIMAGGIAARYGNARKRTEPRSRGAPGPVIDRL
jgi:hypothetical protein